jgi:hypothetical protein
VSSLIRKVRVFSAALRITMTGYSGSNGYSNGLASGPFTTTALNRWSIANKELPGRSHDSIRERELISLAVDKVKVLHVYDFDNTRKFSPVSRTLPRGLPQFQSSTAPCRIQNSGMDQVLAFYKLRIR